MNRTNNCDKRLPEVTPYGMPLDVSELYKRKEIKNTTVKLNTFV